MMKKGKIQNGSTDFHSLLNELGTNKITSIVNVIYLLGKTISNVR